MVNMSRIAELFTGSNAVQLKINSLVLDAGTQQRAKESKDQIEKYAANMEAGQLNNFPPLCVMELTEPALMADGSTLEVGALVLVDGFHRIGAAHMLKLETFQCKVERGTLEEAIYASMRANSTNGLTLGGKDYQVAIRHLYKLDKEWRGHGKKKEIAALLGCSEKTVQRATAAIDAEIKAESFKMFEAGATDSDVAAYAVITVQTAASWRKEWEEAKAAKQGGDDNPGAGDNPGNDNAGTNNPLDLTFAQVLALKDSQLKAQLLKMLMDSIKADNKEKQAEPEQPAADDEPPFDANDSDDKEPEQPAAEGVKDNKAAELAAKWAKMTCWEIMGLERDKLAAMANPKAAIKRAFAKNLKDCHPDHYGENAACDMLKNAQDEILKYFK